MQHSRLPRHGLGKLRCSYQEGLNADAAAPVFEASTAPVRLDVRGLDEAGRPITNLTQANS